MASLQDYLDVINNSRIRKPLIKLEFLRREDETPLFEVISDMRLEGSLNISNGNGVRRTMSAKIDNKSKEYFPSIDSNIWIGNLVQLYMGLELSNGENYFIPNGVFAFENPSTSDDLATALNGLDKFSKLDGTLSGKIKKGIIVPKTTTLGNAIRSMMTLSTDVKDPIIDVDLDSVQIDYDIIKEVGDTIGSVLLELAFAYSANCYYNEEGFLVFEKDVKDSTKGSQHTFNANLDSETNYISGNTQYNLSDVYNSILVRGDNVNGVTVEATVQNNDLTSETSIPNVGEELVWIVEDDIIPTIAYCIERGKYELKRRTTVLTQSGIICIPMFHLDVDKVVTTSDNRQNTNNKRKLVDRINIPFNNTSNMNITVVDTFDIDL